MRLFPLLWTTLLATILAALPISACAAQDAAPADGSWMPLGRGPGALVLLDTSRIGREGTARLVWLRFDSQQPSPVPGQPGKTYTRMEVRQRIDCATRKVRDLAMVLKDSTDAVVNETLDPATRWNTFDTHPLGSTVLPTLCLRLRMLEARP